MEYTRIIAAFCILGFNGIAKLFILATETAHHLEKWTSSTDFLTIKYGECVHLQLWSPCWKIKSTKPQLAISGTLNHKLNLLINVNSSCFYSTLKTLFELLILHWLWMASWNEFQNQQVRASLLYTGEWRGLTVRGQKEIPK